VEATRKYAQEFIKPNQGHSKGWGTQSKNIGDYVKSDKVLLFSSPVTIQKVVAAEPSLLGSLCAPMKEAAKDRTVELPWWVEFGGGVMNVVGFVPGVGQVAAATFGVVSAGVRISHAQDKLAGLKEVKRYVGMGDAQEDRNYEKEERVRAETQQFIRQQESEIKNAKTAATIDVLLASIPSVFKILKGRKGMSQFLDEMNVPAHQRKQVLRELEEIASKNKKLTKEELKELYRQQVTSKNAKLTIQASREERVLLPETTRQHMRETDYLATAFIKERDTRLILDNGKILPSPEIKKWVRMEGLSSDKAVREAYLLNEEGQIIGKLPCIKSSSEACLTGSNQSVFYNLPVEPPYKIKLKLGDGSEVYWKANALLLR
jgi:hypothetical protein